MEAAIVAAGRGHQVTLYEKNDFLGGQIKHADYASFKWPLKDFKDYLIRQVYKAGVDVKLSTTVTRELLEKKDYDAVIVAIGPTFVRPDIPGADGDNTMFALDVYGIEDKLPEKIVVIGGSENGVETGMYLAENGHKVTVMSRQRMLASDAAHAHYVAMLEEAYKALKNFSYLTEVKYTAIDKTGVSYVDKDGKEGKVAADLVVLATGAVGKYDECQSLYGAGIQTFYIGDCNRVGDVHKAISGGFAAANQI
jgi:pyruvate/2-oxoglutarate dehydrogenase complex dihydrolipoamide dehydrogenase (E3) component